MNNQRSSVHGYTINKGILIYLKAICWFQEYVKQHVSGKNPKSKLIHNIENNVVSNISKGQSHVCYLSIPWLNKMLPNSSTQYSKQRFGVPKIRQISRLRICFGWHGASSRLVVEDKTAYKDILKRTNPFCCTNETILVKTQTHVF